MPAALLHLLSLRLLSIETCVALEVMAATVLPIWMWCTWLGRGLPTLAVLGGAAFLLLDPGYFTEGGMVPLIIAGIWPFRICVAA